MEHPNKQVPQIPNRIFNLLSKNPKKSDMLKIEMSKMNQYMFI